MKIYNQLMNSGSRRCPHSKLLTSQSPFNNCDLRTPWSVSLTSFQLSSSWILSHWALQPWSKWSKVKLQGHSATGIPKPQRSLQLWADPLAGCLFDNIRGGIRSLSYANMKGTPPISVTSAILEWSQGMKGKKCGFLPMQLIPFFKGDRWWRGKTGRESVPCIENLGSFPEWVRVNILFWNSISVYLFFFFGFFFFSFWAVGWLHPQLFEGNAVNNRSYFWGFGCKKNLAFPSPPTHLFID